MKERITPIIIPTYNNLDHLIPCLRSIVANTIDLYKLVIVNNGAKETEQYLGGDIEILYPGENLGWTGGINYALDRIGESNHVMFLNDDTRILPHDYDWLFKMRKIMDNDPSVAAVGPTSNVVAGLQHFELRNLPAILQPKYLIGFCVLMNRKHFDAIGRMDESLPGGDDLDWSIRLRKAGHKLVIRRDVYVHHYGFQTGIRLHGDHTQEGGWNSRKMQDETNHAIIAKHGFKWFMEMLRNEPLPYDLDREEYGDGGVLKKICIGKGVDVGCGNTKITPETIGIDKTVGGGKTDQGTVSIADIKANGDDLYMFENESLDYVVARHNLEHYSNPIKTLREWNRVLKSGGKIGITTPDDGRLSAMRLDETHRHSFSRDCVVDLLETTGFKVEELGGTANQWNIYAIAHKNGDGK